MTVSELIKELKKYPKDARVFAVADWEDTDDEGRFRKVNEIESTSEQTWYDDTGFDRDYTEVLIY
jgi:hypothetical protein